MWCGKSGIILPENTACFTAYRTDAWTSAHIPLPFIISPHQLSFHFSERQHMLTCLLFREIWHLSPPISSLKSSCWFALWHFSTWPMQGWGLSLNHPMKNKEKCQSNCETGNRSQSLAICTALLDAVHLLGLWHNACAHLFPLSVSHYIVEHQKLHLFHHKMKSQ